MSKHKRKCAPGERLVYLFFFIVFFLTVTSNLIRYREQLAHPNEESPFSQQPLHGPAENLCQEDHPDLIWWFLPASLKVIDPQRQEDSELSIAPGFTIKSDASAAFLYAARGEYESTQLVLYTDQEISALQVQYTPTGTNPLPATWIEIYRVLTVDTPGVAKWGFPESKPERRSSIYPDPLLPLKETLILEPGIFCILWLSVQIPRDAAGGEYTGEIFLGPTVRAPLHLKVWPFAIPVTPSLRTAFGLGGAGLAAQHRVLLYSDEYQEIYRRYYDALLDYRINAYHVPYGGGGAGGSPLDPRARPYLEDERVKDFIGYYHRDAARMTAIWGYLDQLGVSQKGWIYNLDEPLTEKHYETIEKQSRYLENVIPDIPYGVTFYTGPSWDVSSSPLDYLSSAVDRWIVQTNYFMQGRGLEESVKSQLHQAHSNGDEIWLYVALAPREPYCNLLINNAALQHRLIPWQCYSTGITSGFLYWQTTYWQETADPLADPATVKEHDPNLYGDGSLFYPGLKYGIKGPLCSIRLYAFRDGLEDYEYLLLAEHAFGREKTMDLVNKITPTFVDYIEDPFCFELLRQQLGEKLSLHYGRGGNDD